MSATVEVNSHDFNERGERNKELILKVNSYAISKTRFCALIKSSVVLTSTTPLAV